MAAKKEVTFIIRARDATRGVFRRIRRGIFNLRSALAGLAVGAVIRNLVGFASAVDAASRRLQVNSEQLQALRIQAEAIGVPFETLVGVLQRIQRNAGEALSGNQQLADSFRRMGVSLDELQGLTGDELFFRLADGMQRLGIDSKRARADLARIGDVEIQRLLPLMEQGAAGLRENFERLSAQGAVRDAEELAKLAEAERQSREAMAIAQAELSTQLVRILPAVTELLSQIADLLEGLKNVRELPEDIAFGANRLGNVPARIVQENIPPWAQRMIDAMEKTAQNTEDFGELS